MTFSLDDDRDIETILGTAPVVPVLVIEQVDLALDLAKALAAAAMTTLEITLRTRAALEAVKLIREALPNLCIGVGSVRTPAQLNAAALAGAAFAVSPGAGPKLLDAAHDDPLPFLPGAATASEAMALAERGYTIQKFFPAEPAGGTRYLRALAGPLPELRFCPTGGVTAANARDYLALDNVIAVGGSWMVPSAAVASGDWVAITELARAAVAIGQGRAV